MRAVSLIMVDGPLNCSKSGLMQFPFFPSKKMIIQRL